MRNDDIFKSWLDIKEWAEANGYKRLAARLELNNRCWYSSGEFGRSQVILCDSMRQAEDLHEVASLLELELSGEYEVVNL